MTSSETRLQAAAEVAGNAILASYLADAEPDHQFSPEFEQKMDLLIRDMQRPQKTSRHPVLQKAAGIILAIVIGSGIRLTIDTDARAAVFSWIKEQYENIFHYHFTGNADATSEQSYELGWLPEGYRFHHRKAMDGRVEVIYTNEFGSILSLFYTTDQSDASLDVFVIDESATVKRVAIGDIHADLYITNGPDNSNALAWTDTESNTLFLISCVEDETALIKMAENISLSQK